MDSQIVRKNIEVVCGESHVQGTLDIHHFSQRERSKRALKTALICLCVLLVCACIPGAHFILVPLCLLTSPFIIRRVWKIPAVISSVSARCAVCSGELSRVTTRERYPIYETCLACHRENRILLLESE